MVAVRAFEKGWMIDSHRLRCGTTLKDTLIRRGVRSSPWFCDGLFSVVTQEFSFIHLSLVLCCNILFLLM